MEFESKRLMFREFNPEDYEAFASVFSDERVMEYAYMDRITDTDEMLRTFNQLLENKGAAEQRGSYEFAVFLKTDGSFIGDAKIFIRYQNSMVSHGEIGYFLLPQFWGRGFASEIAEWLAGVCFEELEMHKVVASCNVNNYQSEKIMKKIGMVKEGLLRKERFKNGRWDDELRYSLLAEEWERRRKDRL